MKKPKGTLELTDEFLVEILAKVRHIGDGVDVNTQIEFFREMVRWNAIKYKVAPETDEGSKIDEYRNALKTSGSGGGERNPRAQKSKETAKEEINPRDIPSGFSGLTSSKHNISPSHGAFSVANGGLSAGGFGGTGPLHDETIGGSDL